MEQTAVNEPTGLDLGIQNSERTQRVHLKISLLREDLKNGLTRCKDDKNYNPEVGSIEEKYGLSKDDVKEVFKHPKLRQLKTIPVRIANFVLEDDLEEQTSFGSPTQAALDRMHNNLVNHNNQELVGETIEEVTEQALVEDLNPSISQPATLTGSLNEF